MIVVFNTLSDTEYKEFEEYLKQRFPDLYAFIKRNMKEPLLILRVAAQNFYRVKSKTFRTQLPEDILTAACVDIALFRKEPEISYTKFLELTGLTQKDGLGLARRQIFSTLDLAHIGTDVKEAITDICDKGSYPVRFLGKDIRMQIKKTANKVFELIVENKVINVYNTWIIVGLCIYIALELHNIDFDREMFKRIIRGDEGEFESLLHLIYDNFNQQELNILI